eukprot:TRINITY_DN112433_c0_g1_i1.p1 TRINITY_DN112433_c0_g1~~TRINITY_DN112433_c0_g1_i1.p1  ORF type:complete len:271 (-),score=74.77 TRINITY_DN112433_c0_g1_i1:300-1112(-)
MGCGASGGSEKLRKVPPAEGVAHDFVINSAGGDSVDWVVSSKDNPAPWLLIQPSANLKSSAGTVKVIGHAKAEIAGVDVGDVTIKKVEVKDKESIDWWDGDMADSVDDHCGEATILWGIGRKVEAESIGLLMLAHYSGVASAGSQPDVAVEDDGKKTGEEEGDGVATCKGMSISVSYGDGRYEVQHNFGRDLKNSDTETPILKVPELGVAATLTKGWSGLEYEVKVEASAKEPVQAMLIGFMLARYFHPKRAEERAADKAEEIAGEPEKK